MALPSNSEWIDGASLKDWQWKAKGGFGHIYKARHIKWGWDVAIKVLQQYEGQGTKLLLREAELMTKGGSNFVIRVQGVFRGLVPGVSSIQQVGLVMEFMERGSLASLQEALDVPPQKPLVFQMAHQVALGMNYLHSLTPPLLHLDLKPGNVLLDKDLNVKITDFGLSKIYTSMMSMRSGGQPGTIKYMPPEALTSISYKAIGAYDIYSYGILLWSIVMWKEPYENAITEVIVSLIPKKQRPSLEEMNTEQDPGLEKLKELMQKCWDHEPKQRPPFRECIAVTEDLCKEHEITDAVHQVQKKLAQQVDEITQPSVSSNGKSLRASSRMLTVRVIQDVVDSLTSTETAAGTVSPNGESKKASSRVIVARPPAQDAVGLTDEEKAAFVIQHKATLIQKVPTVMAIVESLGTMVHHEIYADIGASQNTSMEQMRILYRKVIVPLGTAVRAAFYDALEEHQPSLLQDLGF